GRGEGSGGVQRAARPRGGSRQGGRHRPWEVGALCPPDLLGDPFAAPHHRSPYLGIPGGKEGPPRHAGRRWHGRDVLRAWDVLRAREGCTEIERLRIWELRN